MPPFANLGGLGCNYPRMKSDSREGMGSVPWPFPSEVSQGCPRNLGSSPLKREPDNGGISRGTIILGSAPWNSFSPNLPENSSGMSAYCTDKEKEEG